MEMDILEFLDGERIIDYRYGVQPVEGFVCEDSTGFMFRMKTKYYRFWKQMRGVAQGISRGHTINTSQFLTPLQNQVYAFMRDLGRDAVGKMIIIQVRKEFEKVQTWTKE